MSALTNVNNSVPSDFTLVLPPEITREVFSFLLEPALSSAAQVNKKWNQLLASNQLWVQIGKSLQITNFKDEDCKGQVRDFLSKVVYTEDELFSRMTNFYTTHNPKKTSSAIKYISGTQPDSCLYVLFKAVKFSTDYLDFVINEVIFNSCEKRITIIGKKKADFALPNCPRYVTWNKRIICAKNVQYKLYEKAQEIFEINPY